MRKVLLVACVLLVSVTSSEARHRRWHWHGHYVGAAPYAYGFANSEDSLGGGGTGGRTPKPRRYGTAKLATPTSRPELERQAVPLSGRFVFARGLCVFDRKRADCIAHAVRRFCERRDADI